MAVAVVGMACRLPGARDPESFWELLMEGRDAVTDVPEGRWTLPRAVRGEDAPGAAPGIGRGGFLDHVDGFDADFFGISPREAAAMDPQQRLMLELSWEALEDAGIVPGELRGSRTGVFAGVMADDYATLARRLGPEALTRHSVTGLHRGVIANRISFVLGLHGPSMAVDTGQSSSLVAVHTACESLRAGTSTLALAGGVNLNLAAESAVATSRFGALSPDGRCFTFDARANGYVRGEGAGVVLLKPLDRAVADGDDVYCVVLGGDVNNDGATDALTRPSAALQARVVRAAQRSSGVLPADVGYVELHGTGTRVGDPVEAEALGAVFAATRKPGQPLKVGSAKTNVGHLEGAAGIVGFIKAALCVSRGKLPPSLHFEHPNPAIAFDAWGLRVQRVAEAWPGQGRRVAGVSSFGMGGTNCHVVVAEAPPVPATPRPVGMQPDDGSVVLPFSAKSPTALRAQAGRLREYLERWPDAGPGEVARTLVTRRTTFEHWAVVSADDRTQALDALHALADSAPHTALTTGQTPTPARKLAFLFPGQGCQYPGMGRGLYGRLPVFTDALDDTCRALDEHLQHPLRDIILARPDTPQAQLLTRTDYTQP
ncbi:type I polyketide synthase, partial [Streptomyces sp. NPDC058818]|uniref:type I polyketide synthase n=1 Tax=Streptomyces sp. NPDC058818 TaxID=3346640 RepID=UPI0036AE0F55